MSISSRLLVAVFAMIYSGNGYPYDIHVTDIKADSALIHWESTELLTEEFLIHCTGSQDYTEDNDIYNAELHVQSQYVPKGMKSVRIGNLRPNYNYTCMIVERLQKDAQAYNGVISRPVNFFTDYAVPVKPKAALIVKQDGFTRVHLFKPKSSKNGPISGYMVQFHVMKDSLLSSMPAEIDEVFKNPFGKLSPVDVEYAQASPKALSFQLSFKKLPQFIEIGEDLIDGALKSNSVYRVVTVAYTIRRDLNQVYTASTPSDSFVAVGLNKDSDFEVDHIRASHVKIAIVVGIAIPLVCLLYMCCIGALLLCREHYLSRGHKEKHSFLESIFPIKSLAALCRHRKKRDDHIPLLSEESPKSSRSQQVQNVITQDTSPFKMIHKSSLKSTISLPQRPPPKTSSGKVQNFDKYYRKSSQPFWPPRQGTSKTPTMESKGISLPETKNIVMEHYISPPSKYLHHHANSRKRYSKEYPGSSFFKKARSDELHTKKSDRCEHSSLFRHYSAKLHKTGLLGHKRRHHSAFTAVPPSSKDISVPIPTLPPAARGSPSAHPGRSSHRGSRHRVSPPPPHILTSRYLEPSPAHTAPHHSTAPYNSRHLLHPSSALTESQHSVSPYVRYPHPRSARPSSAHACPSSAHTEPQCSTSSHNSPRPHSKHSSPSHVHPVPQPSPVCGGSARNTPPSPHTLSRHPLGSPLAHSLSKDTLPFRPASRQHSVKRSIAPAEDSQDMITLSHTPPRAEITLEICNNDGGTVIRDPVSPAFERASGAQVLPYTTSIAFTKEYQQLQPEQSSGTSSSPNNDMFEMINFSSSQSQMIGTSESLLEVLH